MTTGLRERKKADTRRALSEAAARLCLERGYAAVTVADIADAARVSRRTFSNYFAGKAECVAGYGDGLLQEMLELVAAAPAGTPLPELLELALHRLAEHLSDGFDEFVLLIQSEPELQAAELANDALTVDRIADAVAGLVGAGPDDIRPRAFAVAACALVRVTADRWVAGGRPGGTDGLLRQLDAAFTLLDPSALAR